MDVLGPFLAALERNPRLLPILVFAVVLSAFLRKGRRRRHPSRSKREAMRRTGVVGEGKVARILEAAGLPALHDVLLPIGRTATQIDHVAATGRGLLVVETKNFAGMVFGGVRDRRWTHVTGGTKRTFQNPLDQNRTHLAAVSAAAGTDVEGLVVFAGRARFPKGMPDGAIHVDALPAFLASRGRPGRRESAAIEAVRRVASLHDTDFHRRLHEASVDGHA